jgi:MFS family permease
MTLQQGEAPAPDAPPPSARTLFLRVFPNIMLPMFLAVGDQTIVAAALPAIAADLGDVERVSWVVVAYLVATTIAAPVYGRLGDVFGRRRMMLIALGVFATACVLCSLATSVAALAAFRVLQGLGGGGLMTTAQALIGETVPPRERGRYQGYLATVVVTASMFGPVAGGLLSGTFGWRSVFIANLPLALIAAALALRLPARRAAPDASFRFDLIGLALLTTFVVVALGGLAQLTRPGQVGLWGVLGGLALVLASVVLLVRHEKRTPSPLLPMGLLGRPAIWRADALAACHGAALVSLISYLPLYLTTVRGTTATQTGLLLLPLTMALGFGSMMSGRLASATGRLAVIPTIGLTLATAALLVLAFGAPFVGTAGVIAMLAAVTLFMGSVMAVVQVTVQSAAGQGMLGSAAASVQFSRSIGAAIGTATVSIVLFGSITAADPKAVTLFADLLEHGPAALAKLDAATQAELRQAIAGAFRAAFLTIAAFTATGLALAATNPMKRIG